MRVFYTPELKLKLVHPCVENSDRYLDPNAVRSFWTHISARYNWYFCGWYSGKDGYDGNLKGKQQFKCKKTKSGVAEPATTVVIKNKQLIVGSKLLSSVIQEWKISQSTLLKLKSNKRKAVAEILRDNWTKYLSKKRSCKSVVEWGSRSM